MRRELPLLCFLLWFYSHYYSIASPHPYPVSVYVLWTVFGVKEDWNSQWKNSDLPSHNTPRDTLGLSLHQCVDFTVRLLKPGHLKEDCPINDSWKQDSQDFFANGPVKFKIQLCNRWKLLNRLDLSENSPQIYECYPFAKKTWGSFVVRNRCDWTIFCQVPQFE